MALHHSRAQVASIPEGKALLIRALRETNRNDLRTALWILSRTPLATRVDHATTATTDANATANATATATDDVTVATDAVCCLEVNLRWLFSESNSSAILLETIGPDRVHTNLLRCLLEPQQYYLGLPVTETATTGATTTTTTTGVVTVTVVTTNAARHWLNPGVDSDSDSHFHFHSGHRGMTPLARACHRGNVDLARLFLEHGADPNACGADGVTPLIRAVKTGNVRVVNLLLELESEPESESECDESESESEEPSKPKSKSKPNRNASSSRSSSSSTTTATTVAAATTRWGTDLHRYDQQAMSALIHACTTEDHHAATATATSISMTTTMAGALVAAAEATGTPARILVNAYRVDPPLWYASAHGRTRIVEWLIDDCSATASYRRQQTTTTTTTTTTADTTNNNNNTTTNTTQVYDVDVYSSTPLEEACEWGHTATVRALLERDGSDPRTATGRRARALAARAGHAGIAELLDRWAARLDKLESEYSEYPEYRGGGGTIAAGDDAGCPRCEDDAATTTAATTTTTTTTATTTTTTTTTGVLLLPRVLSLTARRRDLAHRILCRNVGEILPFLE